MSGFGGSVKLGGESEYRKALQLITQNLKEVSSEMKAVSSSFDSNDKSVKSVKAQTEALNKVLMEHMIKSLSRCSNLFEKDQGILFFLMSYSSQN